MQKRRTYKVGASTLSLEFGDITSSKADVLVSSDDSYLTMAGGVSAAIRRAAGEGILLEVAKKIPAKLGDVVVTGAGSLPAKHVFHAVTLGAGKATSAQVIAGAARKSLQLLKTLGLSSIAFPAIGAGVAGFSYEDVAVNMADAIVEELRACAERVDVTIYLFDRFGRMQPMDYIQFFEEVAARTRGLSEEVEREPPTPPAPPKPDDTASTKRKAHLDELLELDRERQSLEGRLAQYGSSLSAAEVKKIEVRLKEIQGLRVALLSSVNPAPAGAVPVFISYSHADEELRKQLGNHLAVLEHQGLIATWHDRMIGAGTEWAKKIDDALNEARVILLLISSDFMGSKYAYGIEMKRALERHQEGSARVIPIILRAVHLKGTPFADLQALPRDARPVATWTDRDSAFADITDGLRNAIQDLVGAT